MTAGGSPFGEPPVNLKGDFYLPAHKEIYGLKDGKENRKQKELIMKISSCLGEDEKIEAELGIKPGSIEDLQWRFHISPRFYQELLAGSHNN